MIYIHSAENFDIYVEDESSGIHTSTAEFHVNLKKTPAFKLEKFISFSIFLSIDSSAHIWALWSFLRSDFLIWIFLKLPDLQPQIGFASLIMSSTSIGEYPGSNRDLFLNS